VEDSGRGRGSHSEGQWKAKRVRGGQPGGSLGRFLDRSPKSGFIPRQVSGTSTPSLFPYLSFSFIESLLAAYHTKRARPGVFSFFLCARQFSSA